MIHRTKCLNYDVAGVDEAKQEFEELVEFLRNPEDYGKLGAHVPRGILLIGPPGSIAAIAKVIDDIFAYTVDLLKINQPLLEETSQCLLERGTLDEAELLEIAKRAKAPESSKAA